MFRYMLREICAGVDGGSIGVEENFNEFYCR